MVERDNSMDSEPPVSIKSTDSNLKGLNENGRKRPFLIGVAGGTCCGKVSIAVTQQMLDVGVHLLYTRTDFLSHII